MHKPSKHWVKKKWVEHLSLFLFSLFLLFVSKISCFILHTAWRPFSPLIAYAATSVSDGVISFCRSVPLEFLPSIFMLSLTCSLGLVAGDAIAYKNSPTRLGLVKRVRWQAWRTLSTVAQSAPARHSPTTRPIQVL